MTKKKTETVAPEDLTLVINDDFTAIYVKGKYVTHGEIYDIEDKIYELLGVQVVHDQFFEPNDNVDDYYHDPIPMKKLSDIAESKIITARKKAKALRKEAAKLEHDADALAVKVNRG